MRFRPATPADVPFVLPMLVRQYELHAGWDPAKFAVRPGFEQGYGGWLTERARDSKAVFLVATARDEDKAPPVAFLVGTVETELPLYVLRRYGFIHDIFVDEAYRHEGVGRQLVTLAMERFRELGVTQVRGETAQANGAARELLAKCGFRPTTVVMLAETEQQTGQQTDPAAGR